VGEVFQAARRGKWKAVRYGLDAPVAKEACAVYPDSASLVSELAIFLEGFRGVFESSVKEMKQ